MTEPPKNAGGPGQTGPSANDQNTPPHDTPEQQIRRFLTLLFQPGDVFEVRAPKCRDKPGARYKYTLVGYYTFDAIDKAARDIGALDARGVAPGIYVTMNPVRGDLLARANCRIAAIDDATSDTHIVQRRWLLIDCDSERPKGMSSTDAELGLARAKAEAVLAWLRQNGWPEAILVMSGNGYHLLYRLDVPTDDGGLVERMLAALAAKFSDNTVTIDQSVANASRITKIAGTMARKGDELRGVPGIEDRPHRRAALVSVPETLQPVPLPLLEALAAEAPAPRTPAPPKPPSPAASVKGSGTRFEQFDHSAAGVRGYLERHGITVKGDKRDTDATFLYLNHCPVNADCASTGDSDIAVIVGDDGKIAYKNQHNRGVGLTWFDVREALEPGYKAYAEAANAGAGSKSPGTSGGSGGASGAGTPDSWPEPQPLPDLLPPVMPFDPALLPGAVRDWVVDIAERIQCPIDFPAVSVMVALATLVGRKIGIRPKRHDDWLVVPNLWGGVVGRPGVMKTPAIQEPLKPLKRMEIAAKGEFDAKATEAEAAKLVGKVKQKKTEQDIKAALKNLGEAHRIALESLEDDEGDPVRKRYIVNDSTVEKLGVILNETPNGVLVYRDELIGLLKSLDKEGQEGARAFYLEAWNGTGRYTYDRIARGTIDIEAAIVSIIGGNQPGPLGQYLRGAVREGTGDDGLMQRFQLLVWPDISKEWVNVDRWPDSAARKRANEVFDGLDTFDPTLLGADTDSNDIDGIPFLHFCDDAQVVFDEWRAGLEHTVRSGDLHPALESHLAKYRSLIPSLALIIHLADGNSGPVGLGPLRAAIGWGVYLESHARRIYSQAITPDVAGARSLAKHIVAGNVPDGFALRDVYRKGWSCLGNAEEAKGAVDLLIDLDWLVENKQFTEGRPATVYFINPKVAGSEAAKNLRTPSKGTDRTDRRGGEGASGGSVSPPEGPTPDSAGPNDWGTA